MKQFTVAFMPWGVEKVEMRTVWVVLQLHHWSEFAGLWVFEKPNDEFKVLGLTNHIHHHLVKRCIACIIHEFGIFEYSRAIKMLNYFDQDLDMPILNS
jgi:hypothetical protein